MIGINDIYHPAKGQWAEALRHLATHIGHSQKRNLAPRERRELVIAGKYGVGLLGFWAIGHRFEMRSRVAGGALFVPRLIEDKPTAEIERSTAPIGAPDTFTEVTVLELHDTAQRALAGRRLADYLAAELRGPLLSGRFSIVVHDRLARGLAQKRFEVKPRRFTGERLSLPGRTAQPVIEAMRAWEHAHLDWMDGARDGAQGAS